MGLNSLVLLEKTKFDSDFYSTIRYMELNSLVLLEKTKLDSAFYYTIRYLKLNSYVLLDAYYNMKFKSCQIWEKRGWSQYFYRRKNVYLLLAIGPIKKILEKDKIR
jgi:hypothetical protein